MQKAKLYQMDYLPDGHEHQKSFVHSEINTHPSCAPFCNNLEVIKTLVHQLKPKPLNIKNKNK